MTRLTILRLEEIPFWYDFVASTRSSVKEGTTRGVGLTLLLRAEQGPPGKGHVRATEQLQRTMAVARWHPRTLVVERWPGMRCRVSHCGNFLNQTFRPKVGENENQISKFDGTICKHSALLRPWLTTGGAVSGRRGKTCVATGPAACDVTCTRHTLICSKSPEFPSRLIPSAASALCVLQPAQRTQKAKKTKNVSPGRFTTFSTMLSSVSASFWYTLFVVVAVAVSSQLRSSSPPSQSLNPSHIQDSRMQFLNLVETQ